MFFLCFRDEPAGDVDGMAGLAGGNVTGVYYLKKSLLFWGTFILTGGLVFGDESQRGEEERGCMCDTQKK